MLNKRLAKTISVSEYNFTIPNKILSIMPVIKYSGNLCSLNEAMITEAKASLNS